MKSITSFRYRALLFMCFSFSITVKGQNLPDEMHLSPDGRMLLTGDLPNTGFFDQSTVRNIYLDFPQTNYWSLMQQNYNSKTDIPATMTVDGLVYDSVGVRFKGQTSYSGVANSQKKSFNITLDAFVPGQDIMGYNIINLNNGFQDHSFLHEVYYQHQIKKHIPTAKSAFTKLYINGSNWGVYPMVQQLNGDFLKEWFLSNNGTNWRADRPAGSSGGGGWGDGTAALNYRGPDSSDYQSYYQLKSSTKLNPWDDLVHTCDVLNNSTPAGLDTLLPEVLDVDRTLWFLASEILFCDDDSYVYKGKMDYYAYYEIETGRLTPQEYDGNSAFEANLANSWSPFYHVTNANYPLLNKILARPEWRQRYLAHLRTILEQDFDTAAAYPIIDGYKNMIDTMVQNDPKKIYTYNDFINGVEEVKDFMITRKNFILTNSEVSQTGPQIADAPFYTNGIAWNQPVSMQDVNVRATVSSTNGIDHVNLYYATGIVGNFSKIEMFDDGNHNDSLSGDGIYGATIPGHSSGNWVRYYIEAVSANAAKTVTYLPVGAEHNVFIYFIAPLISSNTAVVINEVMASNAATAADSTGEFDDWIELYNNSSQPVDISGYYLTDNWYHLDKWAIPANTVIPANDYLIIWADEDSSQGAYHTNFKLSGSGENIYLLDASVALADQVTFGQQVTDYGYARVPNGTGNFVIQTPTFAANNNLNTGISDFQTATPSISVFPNPASAVVNIRMNECSGQQLEIYNPVSQLIVQSSGKSFVALNTESFSNGIYIVRCGSIVQKLMIQR
ncbi:MAG TPA: CotH kinase family protein [Bacteroidia bacterium]|nr:CotH kinase family protein [Bacteroidia bacterium]